MWRDLHKRGDRMLCYKELNIIRQKIRGLNCGGKGREMYKRKYGNVSGINNTKEL